MGRLAIPASSAPWSPLHTPCQNTHAWFVSTEAGTCTHYHCLRAVCGRPAAPCRDMPTNPRIVLHYAAGSAVTPGLRRQRQSYTTPLERPAAAVVRFAVLLAPLVDLGLDDRALRLQEVQRLARRELRPARPQVRADPAAKGISTPHMLISSAAL